MTKGVQALGQVNMGKEISISNGNYQCLVHMYLSFCQVLILKTDVSHVFCQVLILKMDVSHVPLFLPGTHS